MAKPIRSGYVVTLEQKYKAIDLYKSGNYNYTQVAKLVQAAPRNIRNFLTRQDFTGQSNSICHRKYEVNDNIFNIIDTEEKAYFLGLLYADGYNDTTKRKTVKIELQEKDVLVLEKFRAFLGTTSPLKYAVRKDRPTTSPTYTLSITNQQISKDLERWGCIKKKSLILEFPTFLEDNLVRHFIRGYFDGDGYVSKLCCGLTSTKNFCEKIKFILDKELNIYCNLKLNKENNNITTDLTISGGIQIRKFLTWIYNNSTIHLDRKYTRYLKHLAYEAHLNTAMIKRKEYDEKSKQLLEEIIND